MQLPKKTKRRVKSIVGNLRLISAEAKVMVTKWTTCYVPTNNLLLEKYNDKKWKALQRWSSTFFPCYWGIKCLTLYLEVSWYCVIGLSAIPHVPTPTLPVTLSGEAKILRFTCKWKRKYNFSVMTDSLLETDNHCYSKCFRILSFLLYRQARFPEANTSGIISRRGRAGICWMGSLPSQPWVEPIMNTIQ